MSHAYPILLDVAGRLIVIIGGGNVAARKCEGLLAAGATWIRVVSPVFSDRVPGGVERGVVATDSSVSCVRVPTGVEPVVTAAIDSSVSSGPVRDGVERVVAEYLPEHLDGAGLVFAATNSPAVNDAVVRDAQARGLLVNRADGSETSPGDFASPAVHRDRAVTVAVSAGGSPMLAARIRDQIAGRIDAELLTLADALRQLRPAMLNDATLTEPQRRERFRRLASDEAIAVLNTGGVPALEKWIAETKFATDAASSSAPLQSERLQSTLPDSRPSAEMSHPEIRDQQSAVERLHSAIQNPRSAAENPQPEFRDPQSAIRNPQSGIEPSQSALENPQSAINPRQSAIDNRPSKIHHA